MGPPYYASVIVLILSISRIVEPGGIWRNDQSTEQSSYDGTSPARSIEMAMSGDDTMITRLNSAENTDSKETKVEEPESKAVKTSSSATEDESTAKTISTPTEEPAIEKTQASTAADGQSSVSGEKVISEIFNADATDLPPGESSGEYTEEASSSEIIFENDPTDNTVSPNSDTTFSNDPVIFPHTYSYFPNEWRQEESYPQEQYSYYKHFLIIIFGN